MTKFQRAKKQTIEKMDKVLRALMLGNISTANWLFTDYCAFCKLYANGHIHKPGSCVDCPIYKAAHGKCDEKQWFKLAENALDREDADKAIPRILAIKMWIEELEEVKDE